MKRRFLSILLAVAAALALMSPAAATLYEEPVPTYFVTVKATHGGTVSVSPQYPRTGDIVTVTVTPSPGFLVTGVSVKDRFALDVEVQKAASHTFTFVQPKTPVAVEAAFVVDAWVCPYTDVPADHWAYNAIRAVSEAGIMKGISPSAFYPSGTVTRQQLWMVLARMSGSTPEDMADARTWAVANRISDGSNPTSPVTRQQMVTLMLRYAQLYDALTVSDTAEHLAAYPDAKSVAVYAVPAMNWALEGDLLDPTQQGTLAPAQPATRAEMAKMLAGYLKIWY